MVFCTKISTQEQFLQNFPSLFYQRSVSLQKTIMAGPFYQFDCFWNDPFPLETPKNSHFKGLNRIKLVEILPGSQNSLIRRYKSELWLFKLSSCGSPSCGSSSCLAVALSVVAVSSCGSFQLWLSQLRPCQLWLFPAVALLILPI